MLGGEITITMDGKAESFFFSHIAKGLALQTGLQAALIDTIAKLPVPKLRPSASWRSSWKPGSLCGRFTMKLMAMLSTPRVESKAISRM